MKVAKLQFFSRLNVIAPVEMKRELIEKGLRTKIIRESRDHGWGFFNIKPLEPDGEFFFSGQLVKYKPLRNEEIVEPKTHELSLEPSENRVIAKSPFFLHVHTGVIAYHPISNKIGIEQFRDEFAKLLRAANDGFFFQARVEAINEQQRIFDAIKRFRIIRRVLIVLHPPNPHFGEHWKDIGERLKALEVGEYKSDYKGKASGMKLPENDIAYREIEMAVDGYGHAEVIGIFQDEDAPKIVRSRDSPVQVSVVVDDDLEVVLRKLLPSFKKIWGRMSQ